MSKKLIVLEVPEELTALALLDDVKDALRELGYGSTWDVVMADSARLIDLAEIEAMKKSGGWGGSAYYHHEGGYNAAIEDVLKKMRGE